MFYSESSARRARSLAFYLIIFNVFTAYSQVVAASFFLRASALASFLVVNAATGSTLQNPDILHRTLSNTWVEQVGADRSASRSGVEVSGMISFLSLCSDGRRQRTADLGRSAERGVVPCIGPNLFHGCFCNPPTPQNDIAIHKSKIARVSIGGSSGNRNRIGLAPVRSC